MTRIRYVNNGGVYTSKTHFVVNGTLVKVRLDASRVEATIYDEVSNTTLDTLVASNMATLKVLVKQRLRTLGVVFTDEVRNRGNTETLDLDNLGHSEVVPTTNT